MHSGVDRKNLMQKNKCPILTASTVMEFLLDIDERRKKLGTAAIFILIPLIGILDYLSGPQVTFSLKYLIPVAMAAWFAGRRTGFIAAVFSTLIWLFTDLATGRFSSSMFLHYWNAANRMVFFMFMVLLLSTLRRALKREHELSRTDFLTGAMLSRSFYEVTELEISRSNRYEHPLTIVYMDIDDFKHVNDTFGHSAGDMLLCSVVGAIKSHVRKSDVVARLGGDEFAILLPETDQDAAREAVAKIERHLIEAVSKNPWFATFSIGVVTCRNISLSVDKLIELADNAMYSVKKSGKNKASYSQYEG
jgi:diguanylate cyclase (GGDEF)-like protein